MFVTVCPGGAVKTKKSIRHSLSTARKGEAKL